MTERAALILGGTILALFALDLAVLRTGVALFVVIKLTDLVEYLSFWR